MKVITLAKAEPILADHPEITSATIQISEASPSVNGYSDDSRKAFYIGEASKLCDVLFQTLPGATIDALMGIMLIRRGNLFTVPIVAIEGASAGGNS